MPLKTPFLYLGVNISTCIFSALCGAFSCVLLITTPLMCDAVGSVVGVSIGGKVGASDLQAGGII